ncbi:MAG: ANTAR domain-containing protein [Butyrivibrio sp.]|nr:ANTAR domain-containing protein [Butyrivibrio sp.]
MASVLISMSNAETAKKIASIIKRSGMLHDINICDTGAEILRIANDRDFGVVICERILRDMNYREIIELMPAFFGTIVLTKDASLEVINSNMVKLILPFRALDLINTVDMITENFYRSLKKKNEPIRRSNEEKKIVDRAKHMLMDRNGLSEEEAFRYIQKSSMEQGRKMSETAQMILTLYKE